MPFVTRSEAFAHFLCHGRNSSHFVWFLADLQFFQTSNHCIFGFKTRGKVTLIALEPLMPEVSPAAFTLAWSEFTQAIHPEIAAFVAVYGPFVPLLEAA